VSRITGIGDISDQLAEAFSRDGFSLVEVMEICTSYGVKSNPGMKLKALIEEAGIEIKVYADDEPKAYQTNERENTPDLFNPKLEIEKEFSATLEKPIRLFLSGTAGEGVQSGASLFVKAGMRCGLNVTKKGSYPVTVGVGFSAANLILSPDPILYTGAPAPDVIIVTSEDGLKFAQKLIDNANEDTFLILDSIIEEPVTKARILRHHFREHFGGRYAILTALYEYVRQSEIIPMEAWHKQFLGSHMAGSEKLVRLIEEEFGVKAE